MKESTWITKIMPISGFHFLENMVFVVIQLLWHFYWNKWRQPLFSGLFPSWELPTAFLKVIFDLIGSFWLDIAQDSLFISDLNKTQITFSRQNVSLTTWLSPLGQQKRNPTHAGSAFFIPFSVVEERTESSLEKNRFRNLGSTHWELGRNGFIRCTLEGADIAPLSCYFLKDHHQPECFPPFWDIRLSNI